MREKRAADILAASINHYLEFPDGWKQIKVIVTERMARAERKIWIRLTRGASRIYWG